MVSLEAISGLGNQKKSLLINELVALGDSHHPLQLSPRRPAHPADTAVCLFLPFRIGPPSEEFAAKALVARSCVATAPSFLDSQQPIRQRGREAGPARQTLGATRLHDRRGGKSAGSAPGLCEARGRQCRTCLPIVTGLALSGYQVVRVDRAARAALVGGAPAGIPSPDPQDSR